MANGTRWARWLRCGEVCALSPGGGGSLFFCASVRRVGHAINSFYWYFVVNRSRGDLSRAVSRIGGRLVRFFLVVKVRTSKEFVNRGGHQLISRYANCDCPLFLSTKRFVQFVEYPLLRSRGVGCLRNARQDFFNERAHGGYESRRVFGYHRLERWLVRLRRGTGIFIARDKGLFLLRPTCVNAIGICRPHVKAIRDARCLGWDDLPHSAKSRSTCRFSLNCLRVCPFRCLWEARALNCAFWVGRGLAVF